MEDHTDLFRRSISRIQTPPYQLLFVGNDFFRKGGPYACLAFEALKKHFDIRLTVISSLDKRCDHFQVSTLLQNMWHKRMQALGIKHYKNLSTQGVREIMAQSDLLLLPTLQDSFGFSIVEGMATGVPTIATDVEAIPEIIEDGKTGLLISVPKNEEGRLMWSEDIDSHIASELIQKIVIVLEKPSLLREFALSARKKYERTFHPNVIGERLRLMYDEAVRS